MAKIKVDDFYKDRIEQIEIDIKRMIKQKKWKEMYKLKSEKEKLQKYLEVGEK